MSVYAFNTSSHTRPSHIAADRQRLQKAEGTVQALREKIASLETELLANKKTLTSSEATAATDKVYMHVYMYLYPWHWIVHTAQYCIE